MLLFIQNFYIKKNIKSHRLCDNELVKYTDKAFKSFNFFEKMEDAVHPDLLNQLYFSSDINETKKSALFGKVYAIELIKNKKPKKKQ